MTFPRTGAALGILLVGPLLWGQLPSPPPLPPAASLAATDPGLAWEPATTAAPRFRISVKQRDTSSLLQKFMALAGRKIRMVGYLHASSTLDIRNATFEEALNAICLNAGIKCIKGADGVFSVGPESDLTLDASGPSDTTEVDVAYRCRNLNAESVANVLGRTFPKLKVITGPLFLSPTIESGNSITIDAAKALGATDVAFKTHDILLSGPVNLVKRAWILAKKLDRPRRQVRINVRLTELSGSLDSLLGVSWAFGSMALQEIPDPTLTNPANSVKGIKFGTFAHSAASIGLALQAQESLGKARTLANPSVSLLDGERSFILIGERRLYPKQTGTNSQGLPIFDVAEVRTGVYLQVAVQIGVEDDLTLTVYPQVSQVSSTVAINNSQYPIIATREAQTTVRLRNGETLAIGGLVTESDTSTVTRVPFLGYIPLIGELFTQRAKGKASSELLLLITPVLERSEAEGEEIAKEP